MLQRFQVLQERQIQENARSIDFVLEGGKAARGRPGHGRNPQYCSSSVKPPATMECTRRALESPGILQIAAHSHGALHEGSGWVDTLMAREECEDMIHPHVCGEFNVPDRTHLPVLGSSPHQRGTRVAHHVDVWNETVHLRICGESQNNRMLTLTRHSSMHMLLKADLSRRSRTSSVTITGIRNTTKSSR